MKRRLTKLVVFLLLGMVVNVAVAWGCAVTGPHSWMLDDLRLLSDQEKERLWQRYIGEFDQDERIYGGTSSSARLTHINLASFPKVFEPRADPVILASCDIVRAGLPFRSLEGSTHSRDRRDEHKLWNEHLMSVRRVLLTERTLSWFGQIPTKPIWPGFAINTFFYAAIVWGLWSSPFTARRMVRRKRGRCINCGYDLRGTSGVNSGGGGVCSECGAQSA